MHKKGFTLLEVLIGLTVLSFIGVIMSSAFYTGSKASVKNDRKRIAVGLAQELIEFAKSKSFGEEVVMIDLHRGFEDFRRTIETEYVTPEDFNVVSPEPTDFIRVTATVSGVNIPDIVLRTVINREANLIPPCE